MALPRKVIIRPLLTQLTGTERIGLEKLDNPYQYELTPQTLDQSSGIAEERAQRIAADQALLAQIIAESVARVAGDTNEANARIAADNAEAQARQNADFQERQARIDGDNREKRERIDGDALLVPKDQLCSLWAGCNLTFLPASDPGFGQPWLSNGYLVVGPVTSIAAPPASPLGLESGADQWVTETGADQWVWG